MTEEVKRRGRPAKQVEAIAESIESAPVAETVAASAPSVAMTFAEVAAWNRANAHLLAPAVELEKKKRPKQKRL